MTSQYLTKGYQASGEQPPQSAGRPTTPTQGLQLPAQDVYRTQQYAATGSATGQYRAPGTPGARTPSGSQQNLADAGRAGGAGANGQGGPGGLGPVQPAGTTHPLQAGGQSPQGGGAGAAGAMYQRNPEALKSIRSLGHLSQARLASRSRMSSTALGTRASMGVSRSLGASKASIATTRSGKTTIQQEYHDLQVQLQVYRSLQI